MSRPSVRMIAIGTVMTLIGVAFDFWLEWQSEIKNVPSTPYYLQYLTPCTVLIGLALAVTGSILWARKEISAKPLTLWACVLLACWFFGLILTPINGHDWSLLFVYYTAFLVGLIFLGLALYRCSGVFKRGS